MSRRRRAAVREIASDPKFKDPVIGKFINYVMRQGKKGIAEKIVYGSLDRLAEKITEESIQDAFHKLLSNVKPHLEVKSRRIGGSTYQIPIEVRDSRKVCLALRWIVTASKARSGHSMVDKLSAELVDAYNNKGEAVKKKENTHKMAEANRAFAHYIW
ncbi:MAG: 30S ribosomal protein S7 [SAR324 cluster bacterium]|nr:30S ribosomal protein S7 [SAR324 cluster bacterium]